MNLETLKYYINKESGKIVRIFINKNDWDKLVQQIENPEIHLYSWFILDGIYIFRNVHIKLNYASFVMVDGDPELDESYSDYDIEILTEDEKIIRDIIE